MEVGEKIEVISSESNGHLSKEVLVSLYEYIELSVKEEALPGIASTLAGFKQSIRGVTFDPLEGHEPASVFVVPQVSSPSPSEDVPPQVNNSSLVTVTPDLKSGDLSYLTLSEAAALIKAKSISPVELIQTLLDKIEKVEPKIGAFATVLYEQALSQARQAEKALMEGQLLGPLHGVPIALKDIIETRGIRTTASSKVLQDYIPQRQATVAEKLAAAGTILIGKTHTHEFAAGGITPTTRNPWNTGHIPGGSSGGSAAAVAAGLCMGAIGTDTAGSIRIPASLCGTVGLKATYGRVSRFGVFALSWSFDHVGPMTRRVRDAALMLQAIAGYDPLDRASSHAPVGNYTAQLEKGIKGLRIGVPRAYFFERIQPGVLETIENAIQTLKDLGGIVEEIDIGDLALQAMQATAGTSAEISSYHQEWNRSSKAELYGEELQLWLAAGELMLATDYLKAQRLRGLVLDKMLEVFKQYDLLVTPTQPFVAPAVGQVTAQFGNEEEAISNTLIRLTFPFNTVGFPALTVPAGFSRGLPVGLQIIGRPFDEATVLRAGYAYEQATTWHLQHPLGI